MAACITPFLRTVDGAHYTLPCGKCPECLKRRASSWSLRLLQEDKRSSSAWFVTFTYDGDHVPISNNGFMTLCKRDLQLFFKRLRKRTHEKIKYYAVGEYGTDNWRPHYHAIIFNAREDIILAAWNDGGRTIGKVHFGSVTGASVGYTLKYMMKPCRIPMHARDDRVKEFAIMSKDLAATT